MTISGETIWFLIPTIILIALATWTYVGGAMSEGRGAWNFFAVVGLLLVGYSLYRQDTFLASRGLLDSTMPSYLSGPLLIDYFGHAMRWLVLVLGALLVLASSRSASNELATDYLGSLLLVLAGLMVLCTAGDLVLIFLGLELVSIPTYILLFLGRRNAASQEATVKYFFLSVLSSALLLYGFSFLYGVAGSTRLFDIQSVLVNGSNEHGLLGLLPLGMLLVLSGIGFKLAIVPFHFYAPDVYQGTTSLNAGLLAVVPKIAGIAVLLRLLSLTLPGFESIGWKVALTLSVVTMTLGNVLALWQQNVRRLLAYSSIAHAGYLMMGLAVGLAVTGGANHSGQFQGYSATLFYLFLYGLATAGTFAALTYLGNREKEVDGVDELAGVGRTHPVVGAAIAVFMFSLAGIPPLAGFFGKFMLLVSALDVDAGGQSDQFRPWFLLLATVGAVNAAIGAAYYLRIVGVMYFRQSVNVLRAEGGSSAWLSTVTAASLVLAATVWVGPLVEISNRASSSAATAVQPHGQIGASIETSQPGRRSEAVENSGRVATIDPPQEDEKN